MKEVYGNHWEAEIMDSTDQTAWNLRLEHLTFNYGHREKQHSLVLLCAVHSPLETAVCLTTVRFCLQSSNLLGYTRSFYLHEIRYMLSLPKHKTVFLIHHLNNGGLTYNCIQS